LDEKYNPRVTWFNLSAGAHNMLDLLYKWKESAVFRQIWKAQLRHISNKSNKLTIEQIEQRIWKESKDAWEAFCRGMVCTCTCHL